MNERQRYGPDGTNAIWLQLHQSSRQYGGSIETPLRFSFKNQLYLKQYAIKYRRKDQSVVIINRLSDSEDSVQEKSNHTYDLSLTSSGKTSHKNKLIFSNNHHGLCIRHSFDKNLSITGAVWWNMLVTLHVFLKTRPSKRGLVGMNASFNTF